MSSGKMVCAYTLTENCLCEKCLRNYSDLHVDKRLNFLEKAVALLNEELKQLKSGNLDKSESKSDNLKIYIVIALGRSFYEFLGVYSSEEKAKEALKAFSIHPSGSSREDIYILEKDVL